MGFDWTKFFDLIPVGLREILQRRKQHRQRDIDQHLGQLHRSGYEILTRIQTEWVNIHEARRLATEWIETVDDTVKTKVSVSSASIFLGDFETIKKTWQWRWDDEQLREIDEMIQHTSEERLETPPSQEVVVVMKEKLARLEGIMKP